MTCQLTTLPFDCLHEIIEYLEKDKTTLHSCLLVNRLLCEISVRILWRDISSYKTNNGSSLSFFNTIIACLPNESKEFLNKNEIFVSTPTSKSPLFNYTAFCKILSISDIDRIVNEALINTLSLNPHSSRLCDRYYLVTKEIVKMFMNQASLKILTYHDPYYYNPINWNFSFPFSGTRNLSEFHCNSNLSSDFFHQLSQICHNLQSISISFENDVSNKLKELISLQNNLKSLTLKVRSDTSWENIIPSLTKHSNTLIKLSLYSDDNNDNLPFSFISLFTNLQEFIFSFSILIPYANTKDFEKLQYVNFPKLQTLKIPYLCPNPEYLMKFLETNGKNLTNIYICEGIYYEGKFNTGLNMNGLKGLKGLLNKNLILSIANFCPNLKRLSVRINPGESYVLRIIFIKCQYLEFISIWCEEKSIAGTIFEFIETWASKYFCELILYNSNLYLIYPVDLESFLISWKNKKPEKLLKLMFIRQSNIISEYEEYEKYIKYNIYEGVYYISSNYYIFDNMIDYYEIDEDIINDLKHKYSYELNYYDQNLKIIEKYEKLGIIKSRIECIKDEELHYYFYY
ncbi:unnamed protein product [Rhizophagus irregularis]|nr:unnamed protein product [Rhizophagus irregularis]CAB5375005.1 unnamed protein product [Rhizophagus irregularis]